MREIERPREGPGEEEVSTNYRDKRSSTDPNLKEMNTIDNISNEHTTPKLAGSNRIHRSSELMGSNRVGYAISESQGRQVRLQEDVTENSNDISGQDIDNQSDL